MEMIEKCRLCEEEAKLAFSHTIMGKYNIGFYACENCGAIFTEKPYWLDEAYGDALTCMDTGIMQRNLQLADLVQKILESFFGNKEYISGVDFAGGYGIMTRLLRDKGYDFKWYDKYAENLVAKGYSYAGEDVDVVTAFEIFEHMAEPREDLAWIFNRNPGIVIVSTLLLQDDIPDETWWYWCFEHGQHVLFWSEKTMHYVEQIFDYKYVKLSDSYHLFVNKKMFSDEVINEFINPRKKCKFIEAFFDKKDTTNRESLTQKDFDEQRELIIKNSL